MRLSTTPPTKKPGAKELKRTLQRLGITPAQLRQAARVSVRGRPQVVTASVLAKLEIAYKLGCSDKEACVFAGIHPATLYRYIERSDDFCEQKEAWRQMPTVIARAAVMASLIAGDIKTAQWYLERKCSEEFAVFDANPGAGNALTPAEIERMASAEHQIEG